MNILVVLVIGLALLATAAPASAESRTASALQLIDLQRSSLAEVAQTAAADSDRAMERMLQYYRTRAIETHVDPDVPLRDLENIPNEPLNATTLEDAMVHRFTFVGETVEQGQQIDWTHRIYDPEWAYMFHRHVHLLTLVEGFRRYGDEQYMRAFAYQLREWDRQVSPDHPRRLETGLRLTTWARLFPVAVRSEHFDAELLAIFLENVHAMAESLNARGPEGYTPRNWGAMEARGVLEAATMFPELRQAAQWRDDAAETLRRHFPASTHADGVYHGQSPHYHNVLIRQALDYHRLLRINQMTVPQDFLDHLHRMLDFAAAYTRPDLRIPQFGDSDADYMVPRLMEWGREFDRPDLLYIATHGAEGTRPQWQDRLFPEGGFALLRSPWDDGPDARWLMLDFGPHGRGAFRLLSVDIAGLGRPLITMPGRYRYRTTDDARTQFISTPFQNTVSINGENQQRNPQRGLARHKLEGQLKLLHAWHDGYSHLAGEGESAFPIIHERQVLMIRDACWIVADLVRVARPIELTFAQNWHFQPTTLARQESFGGYVTQFPEANIALIPLAGEATGSVLDGWYSPRYGVREPAPWLAFEQSSSDGWLFVTLLAPFADQLDLVQREVEQSGNGIRATLSWRDGQRDEIELSFGEQRGTGHARWRGVDGQVEEID